MQKKREQPEGRFGSRELTTYTESSVWQGVSGGVKESMINFMATHESGR